MEPQIQLTVHCQVIVRHQSGTIISPLIVPVVSPSRDGDVTVYVWHKPTQLAHSFLLCTCVYFCLYDPFHCISFHKFSRQLSVFRLCSCGLSSAVLVLSTIYLFMKVSFSPDTIPSGWLGSKHQLTNLTNSPLISELFSFSFFGT